MSGDRASEWTVSEGSSFAAQVIAHLGRRPSAQTAEAILELSGPGFGLYSTYLPLISTNLIWGGKATYLPPPQHRSPEQESYLPTTPTTTWQQSVQLAGVRTQPWTRCSWTAPAISGCAVGWSRAPARSSPGSETARRSGRATERSARGPHGRHEPPHPRARSETVGNVSAGAQTYLPTYRRPRPRQQPTYLPTPRRLYHLELRS